MSKSKKPKVEVVVMSNFNRTAWYIEVQINGVPFSEMRPDDNICFRSRRTEYTATCAANRIAAVLGCGVRVEE